MGSFLNQVGAVIALNVTTIPRRAWMSIASVAAVAIVVFILLFLQSMVGGMAKMMDSTGSEEIAIILREGSEAELNSSMSLEQMRLLAEAPGVARVDGTPLASGELFVVVDGVKKSSGTAANLPLRGVGPQGAALRPDLTITEGRMFAPGSNEIIVGRRVAEQFTGFELDKEITFGATRWKVVGVFAIPGSAFESELWADLPVVQSLFNREGGVQTVRLKLNDASDIEAIKSYMEGEPRLDGLIVRTEKEQFAGSSTMTVSLVQFIAWPLAVVMAIGALMGALNTMAASVETRTREIATLRTIGFSGWAALLGTLAESLALAAAGGVIGALAAYLLFNGFTRADLSSGFTQVVYSFNVSGDLIVTGLIVALVIGLVGGVPPAIRAARTPLTAAQ